jgi:hypothetical protein
MALFLFGLLYLSKICGPIRYVVVAVTAPLTPPTAPPRAAPRAQRAVRLHCYPGGVTGCGDIRRCKVLPPSLGAPVVALTRPVTARAWPRFPLPHPARGW